MQANRAGQGWMDGHDHRIIFVSQRMRPNAALNVRTLGPWQRCDAYSEPVVQRSTTYVANVCSIHSFHSSKWCLDDGAVSVSLAQQHTQCSNIETWPMRRITQHIHAYATNADQT